MVNLKMFITKDYNHNHPNYKRLNTYKYDKEGNRILLGSVRYSVIDKKVFIEMIEVDKHYQHKGIGSSMIEKLNDRYKYDNIIWGMTTKAGHKLKNKMDRLHKEKA